MDQMKMLREELARCCPALELREQEPMSRHTSFHIGGPAALMALPKSREEAACAVRTAAGLGIAPFFMGNGSNLLVPTREWTAFLLNRCRAWRAARCRGRSCWPERASPWPGWPPLPGMRG